MNAKNAWMIYAGINSGDLGVLLRAAPTISSAVRRNEQVEIPGRNGKATETDGAFEPITITVKLAAVPTADLSVIRRWLMEPGDKLVFGDRPDRCYVNARIIKEFKFTPAGVGRSGRYEFDVAFQCDPMMEPFGGGCIVLRDEKTIVNPGDFETAPMLRISGRGDISFAQGDTVQTVTVDRTSTHLYIDCTTGYAFTADCGADPFEYANEVIVPDIARGDLIRLQPGVYTVELDSTITEALMLPRWRWA